jgi:RHS repeat-associated protein
VTTYAYGADLIAANPGTAQPVANPDRLGERLRADVESRARLISAVTTGPEWGQSYAYDGFGNRTSVTVTKGTAPSGNLTYDGMTNRITNSGFSYDANGNLTATPGGITMGYDAENRLAWHHGPGLNEYYGYGPGNQRIWKSPAPDSEREVYFYGVDGRKLAAYRVSDLANLGERVYFAGRLLGPVTDRLGSVRARRGEGFLDHPNYFPWGEERVTTAQNTEKFATYFRDSTGLDYANQRYYSSQHGRFLTPDPYTSSSGLGSPQSSNRYAYVAGDPVNRMDPRGLDWLEAEGWLLAPPGEPGGGGGWWWWWWPEIDGWGLPWWPPFPESQIALPAPPAPSEPTNPPQEPTAPRPVRVPGQASQFASIAGAIPWCTLPSPFCIAVNALKITLAVAGTAWVIYEASRQAGERRDMGWAVDQAKRICGRAPTREEREQAHRKTRGDPAGPRDREDLLDDLLDAMGCSRGGGN